MNAKSLETFAVNAVRDSVENSDYLSQFIPDNDKEPSWDGAVYIYHNKSKKKDALIGRMPVQVKGKESHNHPSEISYRVQISDLRNYLNDGGSMFFVVYISKNPPSRTIYYDTLTPVKLRILIKQANSHKSTLITLKRYPQDGNAQADIFLNCYNDCKKQASFSSAILYTEEDLAERGILEEIAFSVSSFTPNNLDSFFQNEIYPYAKVKGSTIPQPLEFIPTHIHISSEVPASVTVAGKPYYDHYTKIQSADGIVLRFGSSFTITIPSSTQKWQINYTSSDYLRQRATDLSFIISVIDNSGFEINNTPIRIDSTKLDLSQFDLAAQKSQLHDLQDAVSLLDILHCTNDLNLSTMSKTDTINLFRLIQVFVKKQAVQQLKPGLKPILTYRVNNLQFALWFFPQSDHSGMYEIRDFFSYEHPVYYEQDAKAQTSQYALLGADDFLSLDNLQLSVLLPSFQKLALNNHIANCANFMLLDLLTAYDKSNHARADLLETAIQFSHWLYEIPDDLLSWPIRLLNRLQTTKRQRILNQYEEKQLYELIEGIDADDILTGAYLLLGIQKLAERHFQKMSPTQQEEFRSFPIFYFWNSVS